MSRYPGRRVPAVLVAGLAGSLGSVFFIGKLGEEVLEHETLAIDVQGVALARRMRSPMGDRVFSALTATGEPWALVPVIGGVALRWLAERRDADAVTLSLALFGGGALNQLLKLLFRRDRPALRLRRAHASGFSFPSGHAMMTLSTYGTLAYLVARHGTLTRRPLRAAAVCPVLVYCALVGWSRVYLEVHYPTDVLAAWAASTVWVTSCGLARSGMEPEES